LIRPKFIDKLDMIEPYILRVNIGQLEFRGNLRYN
jgi:hypothetical protein